MIGNLIVFESNFEHQKVNSFLIKQQSQTLMFKMFSDLNWHRLVARNPTLKGQCHEKMCEIMIWDVSFGLN
jgi:hypothetical protein